LTPGRLIWGTAAMQDDDEKQLQQRWAETSNAVFLVVVSLVLIVLFVLLT
jgi:hypothetical protein